MLAVLEDSDAEDEHDQSMESPSSIEHTEIHAPPVDAVPVIRGRQRAIAQVMPMSMTRTVRDITRPNPVNVVADIDSRYIPEGFVAKDTSLWSGYNMNREDLKRKAEHISRSECEVFAYLTHNTTSQQEASRLLNIVTNVRTIISIIRINTNITLIAIIYIISTAQFPAERN